MPHPTMKAVCLDMDGTLVDSERLWDVAVEELAVHMGRPLDKETRARTLGASMGLFFEILSEYTGHIIDTEAEFTRLHDRLTSRVAELFATDLQWRPGARELLDTLAAARIPIALVTNTESGLASGPINFLGPDRFEFVVTGDRVPLAKPSPDPYLLACELLRVAPADAVAIEDSVTGATSAVAAGCRVLYVPSTPGQPPVLGSHRYPTLEGVDVILLDALTAGSPQPTTVGESPT